MNVYPNLTFPEKSAPYFYSNFVSTLDGKVQVLKDTSKYWPLGSKLDYETLIDLRTYADVLIHGKKTAGHPTVKSLSKPEFQKTRLERGKTRPILYTVVSNHPNESLIPAFEKPADWVKPMLITTEKAVVPEALTKVVEVKQFGETTVDLQQLRSYFQEEKMVNILVEGGPHLIGTFFAENMIDEIFLTITPKIVGNKDSQTLTMVEGVLLPPEKVQKFSLVSTIPIEDELYLRYRKK